MVQYFPIVTGSLIVSGSITATEGITMSGSIASASFAANAATASFVTLAQTASFVANAQSASNAVAAQTASYANAFTVASTLTAQTLVVQTITSSVSTITGSTNFGSLSINTHTFTGSMSVSGAAVFASSVTSEGVGLNSSLRVKNTTATTGVDWHLYSLNNGNLGIYNNTAGAYAMVITSGSTVGIGTTAPGARLHVSGSVEANGSLYRAIFGAAVQDADMTGLSGGNGSEVQIQAGSSTRGAFLTLGGGMGTSEAMGGVAFYNSNNTDGKRLRAFIVGGQEGATTNEQGGYLAFGTVVNAGTTPAERMRITSDGDVNITGRTDRTILNVGNSSTISNNAAGRGNIIANGSSSAIIQLLTNSTERGYFFHNGTDSELWNTANGYLRFGTNNTERMRVSSSGQVGINTTNIGTEANLYLGAFSANEGGQLVLQKATSYASASHLDNYQNRFRVLSGTDTTSSAERFSVDMTNGNVIIYGNTIRAAVKEYAGQVFPPSPYTADLQLSIVHDSWGDNWDSGTAYVEFQARTYGTNQTTSAYGMITYRMNTGGTTISNVVTSGVTTNNVTISTDTATTRTLKITFAVAANVDETSVFVRTTNTRVSSFSVAAV